MEDQPELVPVSTIVSLGLGKSSFDKQKLAGRLLAEAAKTYGLPDPVQVTPESGTLVINVLHTYSGLSHFESEPHKMKSRNTVGGMIAALRWVYRNAGHIESWSVRSDGDVRVSHGNPLEGNVNIKEFRKLHSNKLAEIGKVARSAPPLSSEQIIEHGKRFLVNAAKGAVDKRDVMLHAAMLTAMNCGIRYDEISKMKLKDMKCSKFGTEFGIGQRCKNLSNYRYYKLRRWPGDHFVQCILMDPLHAMSSWLSVRGDQDGFVFCNMIGNSENVRIAHHEPWPRQTMIDFMQKRFQKIGYGYDFTGHSPKRGGVQLLRFLNCKDAYIMEWFGMTGDLAYLRYTEGFNDVGGNPVPDFSSLEGLHAHLKAREIIRAELESEELNGVEDWLEGAKFS